MYSNRRPDEDMQVDWAGQTTQIVDTDTGGVIMACAFVAVLPYSGYTYQAERRGYFASPLLSSIITGTFR